MEPQRPISWPATSGFVHRPKPALPPRLLDARLASGLTAESRIELLHAKALILEKSGRYEEAFTTLSNAKAMKRSDYFAEDFEAYVSRMVTVMTRGAVTALAAKIGDPDFKPVFIAGVPRSGTTLTEQILSSHSMIGGAGEAGSLGEVLRLLSRSGVGPWRQPRGHHATGWP